MRQKEAAEIGKREHELELARIAAHEWWWSCCRKR